MSAAPFDDVPNEILLHMYSYIREYNPILRKVCRRWHKVIADKPGDIEHCMNRAAQWGLKVYLGEIDQAVVEKYVNRKFYSLVMRAEYTWRFTISFEASYAFFINMYECCEDVIASRNPQLDPSASSCNDISELFAQIATRGRDASMEYIIPMLRNSEIIRKTRLMGMTFRDRYLNEYDVDIYHALHLGGVPWSRDLLSYIVINKLEMEAAEKISAYWRLFTYVIQSDYTVSKADFIWALRLEYIDEAKMMIERGFTMHRHIIEENVGWKLSAAMSQMLDENLPRLDVFFAASLVIPIMAKNKFMYLCSFR